MWKNFLGGAEQAKDRLATALEKTSEVLNDKANSINNLQARQEEERRTRDAGQDHTPVVRTIEIEEEPPILDQHRAPPQQDALKVNENVKQLSAALQQGWGSVVDATRKTVLEAQQHLANVQNAPYKRDRSLPLDVEALKDAEVVYITDRLIAMGHPTMETNNNGKNGTNIGPNRKLAAVGHLLNKRHTGRYMVWNLSEIEYDYAILENEVLPFQFPGSPSPPLGMLLKLLLSMENWLNADPRNVAVVHCLTGRGRTSTVLACFLCWTGEAGFHDPVTALEYVAACKRVSPATNLTIPSQRRYANYFANMLDGVRPHQPPLVLKRIIMNKAPRYGKRPVLVNSTTNDNPEHNTNNSPEGRQLLLGCSPYLQIFKTGKLIFTTAASPNASSSSTTNNNTNNQASSASNKNTLTFCLPSDGPVSFPIEAVIQGDILIRCRHLTKKGQRVSMFRAAFHTGYVATTKVLRLTKGQLDGACADKRFDDDFFLDLIFDACDASMASQCRLLSDDDDDNNKSDVVKANAEDRGETNNKQQQPTPHNKTDRPVTTGNANDDHPLQASAPQKSTSSNEAKDRRNQGAGLQDGHKTHDAMSAGTYDSMLHRDSRFWDVINTRRNAHFQSKPAADDDDEGAASSSSSLLQGPTIGRRRDFSAAAISLAGGGGGNAANADDPVYDDNAKKQSMMMDAFSIGGSDFGFAGDDNDVPKKKKTVRSVAKKDDLKDQLMGALMEIGDDDSDDDDDSDSDDGHYPKSIGDDKSYASGMSQTDKDDLMGALMDIEDDDEDDDDYPTPTQDLTGSSSEAAGGGQDKAVSTTDNNSSDDSKAVKEEEASTPPPPPASSIQGESNNDNNNDGKDTTPQLENNSKEAIMAIVDGMDYDDDDDEDFEDLENFLTKKKFVDI